jgi:hypothetical protein
MQGTGLRRFAYTDSDTDTDTDTDTDSDAGMNYNGCADTDLVRLDLSGY